MQICFSFKIATTILPRSSKNQSDMGGLFSYIFNLIFCLVSKLEHGLALPFYINLCFNRVNSQGQLPSLFAIIVRIAFILVRKTVKDFFLVFFSSNLLFQFNRTLQYVQQVASFRLHLKNMYNIFCFAINFSASNTLQQVMYHNKLGFSLIQRLFCNITIRIQHCFYFLIFSSQLVINYHQYKFD